MFHGGSRGRFVRFAGSMKKSRMRLVALHDFMLLSLVIRRDIEDVNQAKRIVGIHPVILGLVTCEKSGGN
jgi:hypothetical protein